MGYSVPIWFIKTSDTTVKRDIKGENGATRSQVGKVTKKEKTDSERSPFAHAPPISNVL